MKDKKQGRSRMGKRKSDFKMLGTGIGGQGSSKKLCCRAWQSVIGLKFLKLEGRIVGTCAQPREGELSQMNLAKRG